MKKIIMLTLATFYFSLFTLKAQGIWTSRDTLPDSAMVQGITGFSIGNYGYAGLGENVAGINQNYFWQFDPSTDIWARKANFPGRARVAPACFVIGDTAYLVTGSVSNDGACVTECWAYYPATNTWAQKADFPGPARTYAVGFAINGKGYVGTGANELSNFRKDFYRFNPDSNAWIRIADFGGIARDGDCGFAANGKGYVCFGQDSLFGSNWLNNDMWEYNATTNVWTQKSNCPGFPMYAASGFTICNNIYVGSGDDSSLGFNPVFWQYNTMVDSWTQVARAPGITKVQGAAFAIEDTGYYGFGIDSNINIIINIFDKFYDGDSCNIITGYHTLTDVSDIGLYPNPFNTKCFIRLPDVYINQPVFTLYNMEGVKQKIDIQGDGSYYTLKRNNLKNGVYILSIEFSDQVYHKKLVITN